LHLVVEILHPEADAVESQRAQVQQLREGGDAWIGLDAQLRTGSEAHVTSDHRPQPLQLRVRQVVRRPSSPVHVLHGAPVPDDAEDRRQLILDAVEVRIHRRRATGGNA
jgi:hypothetical protein